MSCRRFQVDEKSSLPVQVKSIADALSASVSYDMNGCPALMPEKLCWGQPPYVLMQLFSIEYDRLERSIANLENFAALANARGLRYEKILQEYDSNIGRYVDVKRMQPLLKPAGSWDSVGHALWSVESSMKDIRITKARLRPNPTSLIVRILSFRPAWTSFIEEAKQLQRELMGLGSTLQDLSFINPWKSTDHNERLAKEMVQHILDAQCHQQNTLQLLSKLILNIHPPITPKTAGYQNQLRLRQHHYWPLVNSHRLHMMYGFGSNEKMN